MSGSGSGSGGRVACVFVCARARACMCAWRSVDPTVDEIYKLCHGPRLHKPCMWCEHTATLRSCCALHTPPSNGEADLGSTKMKAPVQWPPQNHHLSQQTTEQESIRYVASHPPPISRPITTSSEPPVPAAPDAPPAPHRPFRGVVAAGGVAAAGPRGLASTGGASGSTRPWIAAPERVDCDAAFDYCIVCDQSGTHTSQPPQFNTISGWGVFVCATIHLAQPQT